MDRFYYWDEITRTIVNESNIYIYGAGLMGKALERCLAGAPYHKSVKGFIVSQKEDNPSMINGIPVLAVESGHVEKSAVVLVALHEKNMESVAETLMRRGFANVYTVSFDSDVWCHIRGNWMRANGIIGDECEYSDELDIPQCNVYVVHSCRDKKLLENLPLNQYEIPIQVGKKMERERLFLFCDDEGENISEKNRQYCELTALYWIWKHRKAKYIGLCHYRRRFNLSQAQWEMLPESEFDMVVTMPVINMSGVKKQYGLDHSIEDWEIMMEVIRERSPEYYEAAVKMQESLYYYGYNMFMARYDVFCGYCAWLFGILEECEKRIGSKEDVYQNRYIGYMAERLLGVYIDKNNLKVLVADKYFVEQ